MGIEPPRTGTENGTRKALGRSGSRKRRRSRETFEIVKASIAPKAKIPARNLRLLESVSPKAATAARVMAT